MDARLFLPLALVAMGCSDWQLQPPTGYDGDDAGVSAFDRGAPPVDVGVTVDSGCGALDQRCCLSDAQCLPDLSCYSGAHLCLRPQCTMAGTQCPSFGQCCAGTSCVVGHNALSYCCLPVNQACDPYTSNVCCGAMSCTNAGTGQYHCQ